MAGRPRAFDEKEVLRRAMELFWLKGYATTSISDLEEATGLGRQSLYGVFGDKRGLFEQVVEHYEQTVLRPGLHDVLEAPGSALGNLERVLEYWQQAASTPGFNGCLVGSCIAEMGAREPELADLLAAKLKLMEDWFWGVLDRAQQAGEISRSLDARATARSLLALSQGLALVARVNRDKDFARSIVASAVQLLEGARAEPRV